MTPPEGRPRLDPDEDARLVELCLAGDARGWEALVRRHERLVYAVARSYRLSNADVGDVFQDVFAALVRGLPRIRDARALVRWLSSTTDRIARALALQRRREMALGLADDPVGIETRPAQQAPVEAGLEELEAQALVRLALLDLPVNCRRLLTALYYEDPPPAYADLARRLGVPIGSLGPTRARCLERLRRILARLEAGSGGPDAPRPGITSPGTPTFQAERDIPGAAGTGHPPSPREDRR
jgi:RNA polymerase sigma factor (sigma-70 family)